MPRGTVVTERFRLNRRAPVSKGIVRAGDWIINHKGLIRKVAEGSTVSEEWNWPATVDDGFRLAKLPKPEGSIIANVYGELCAMRDDGIIIGHQNLLTRFRVKTFITGEGAKTFWHKDGTHDRVKVIDISRLPLSDAIPLLPECVLACLDPGLVSKQKPLDDDKANRPGGSSGTKENDRDSLTALVKELSEAAKGHPQASYPPIDALQKLIGMIRENDALHDAARDAYNNGVEFANSLDIMEFMVRDLRTTLDKVREAGL